MIAGGLVTVAWEGWVSRLLGKAKIKWRQRNNYPEDAQGETTTVAEVELQEQQASRSQGFAVHNETVRSRKSCQTMEALPQISPDAEIASQVDVSHDHIIKIRVGLLLCGIFFGEAPNQCFFASASLANLASVFCMRNHSLRCNRIATSTVDLFANMYLAGTIIFGGGSVVIPLLRSYVVDPGWVSGRDFLIGLALIQAFPGPNFNFTVFLGSLAISQSRFPSILGAFLGFVGIYLPGITLAVSVQSFWRVLRSKKWVVYLLRGINATAVGLIFTAVYRLWEVGHLTSDTSNGQSLDREPWWVVVAAVTYVGNAWFNVPPAIAIISGGVLGLCR